MFVARSEAIVDHLVLVFEEAVGVVDSLVCAYSLKSLINQVKKSDVFGGFPVEGKTIAYIFIYRTVFLIVIDIHIFYTGAQLF